MAPFRVSNRKTEAKVGLQSRRRRGAKAAAKTVNPGAETEQRHTQALEASEARYRLLFESAPHGILILDARTGVIEEVNPYLLNMLGYSRSECVGKRFWEVDALRDIEASQSGFEALQSNTYFRRESLLLRAKGDYLIEAEFISIVYEEKHRKMMQCQIRALAGRLQTDGTLPPAEAELRALFASMRDVVLVIDRRGIYLEIAPTDPGLLYQPPHELLGKQLGDVFPSQQAEAFLETIRQVLETGKSAQIEYELRIGERLIAFSTSIARMGPDRTLWVARDITERRRILDALQQSEEKYRGLFNVISNGIFVCDVRGFLSLANPALARMLGVDDPNELVGRNVMEFVAPSMLNEFAQAFGDLAHTGEAPPLLGVEVVWRDGTQRSIEIKASAELDHGQVLGAHGIVRDVTEHKMAEEALQESEARFRLALDNSPLVVSRQDAQLRYLWIYNSHPGFDPEFVIGKTDSELLAPEDAARLTEIKRRVLQTGSAARAEVSATINGETFVHDLTVEPLRDTSDNVIGVTNAEMDITERKQAEEVLGRLAAIVESSDDAIIGKTLDGVITSWNSGAQRLFGYSAEEAIGQPVSLVVPPDRHDELLGILSLLERGERVEHLETVRVRKDGVRLDVSVSSSPIRDGAGRVVAAASISRDITERKRVQDELRGAKDTLESTNRDLQQSLAREELLARTDGLTGLCNRIHFDELARREFHAAVRHQRPLTILMMDVDNFKQINDSLGHAAGDDVLALIAHTAAGQLRGTDVLARFGGDEFILLLSETTAQQGLTVADRLRAGVAAIRIPDAKDAPGITLSIGIAELRRNPMDEGVKQIVQRADDALYRAKAGGRNRAVIFESGMV